jgi:asparagine synthase (glutamine-hydrolysing)
MCGIAGTTGVDAERRTAAMLPLLRHRGPDDSGLYVDRPAAVAIGATRLSIIDVAGGHQPLSNESNTVHCVLNGEIYNFRALRERLARKGHVFRTRTDTEILVHLYEDYGSALVHALDGMYAFALWDARSRTLLLARDRFGEKPLFVHEVNGRLTFASELTALRRGLHVELQLDPHSIDQFFALGYVAGSHTIFAGVEQLEPGTIAEWRLGQPLRRSRYWSLPEYAVCPDDDSDGLVEEMVALVRRAVESRMVADVPVGVFLSGGVDSSLVAAYAARFAGPELQTFSVDYDVGSVSETAPARRVAGVIGTQHHAFTLTANDVRSVAPRFLAALDQPLADPAFVALSALSEYARGYVTVALGGEGADEIFGGYPRYRWLSRLPKDGAGVALARALRGAPAGWLRTQQLLRALKAATPAAAHISWVAASRLSHRSALLGPKLEEYRQALPALAINGNVPSAEESRAGYLMRHDTSMWLPDDVLAKADRASMLASLESRAPFLARELVEFAVSVPTSLHLSHGGKRLVRAALARALPSMPTRRRKVAFRVPVAEWLRGPLRAELQSQLESNWIYDGWFDRGEARGLAHEHLSGDADHGAVLWPLFALGCWSPS